jgi:membrane protein
MVNWDMNAGAIFLLLKNTVSEWSSDGAPRLGASLAYYTIFSLAPLLVITITIAGLAFDNAEAQVLAEVQRLIGEQGSALLSSMIAASRKTTTSSVATMLAGFTLIFGAAGVFIQLKNAFNIIWNVPQKSSGGVWAFFRKYLLSFSMVLGLGFLMLVSLLITAGLAAFGEYLDRTFPQMGIVMKVLAFVVPFLIITVLFALLFKYLPDVKVAWKDVWVGAFLTSACFVLGKLGLGLYIGNAKIGSAYGAAGSLVLILLWVYYSAQILFFGAEFTQVFAKYHGSHRHKLPPEPPANRKGQLRMQNDLYRRSLSNSIDHIRN